MLSLWEKIREVPQEAQKTIKGGRLKDMTDINPMWRLKTLTENFGLCGIGWKYEIISKELKEGEGGAVAAIVDINLYIKVDGEWSAAIPGTGGSMFVAKERGGLYTSDECFKMALTDAISVSCKALGMGADIYWSADATKYSPRETADFPAEPVITKDMQQMILDAISDADGNRIPAQRDYMVSIYKKYGYETAGEIKVKDFKKIMDEFYEHSLPFDV